MTELDPHPAKSCGLYIDVENLQNHAQELVESLINNWPSEKAPPPTLVTLYVRADMVALWNAWSLRFPSVGQFKVKGIQHYTERQSKNSADIAIALDAITDLLKQQVNHVAVLSDDSDFISLFSKVRTEAAEGPTGNGRVPFLWIITDRDGTKTPNMQRFFPEEYLHSVSRPSQREVSSIPINSAASETLSAIVSVDGRITPEEKIAEAIIRNIPLGTFKSTDCQEIIRLTCPEHPLVGLPNNRFGIRFVERIWPLLNQRGVERGKSKPIRYEMTQVAQDSLAH